VSALVAHHPWPIVFGSGASRLADLRGQVLAGISPGVVATELVGRDGRVSSGMEVVLRDLEALRGTELHVFLDSGAFSEVDSQGRLVKPISDQDWRVRLKLYARLARSLGDQLYLVAPDKRFDQVETLARIERFAPELHSIHALGAKFMVPLQQGRMDLREMLQLCEGLLGFTLIPAFPTRNPSMTDEVILSFVRDVQPGAIHLLGMGPKNHRSEGLVARIQQALPGISITQDANLIAAMAVKSPPRALYFELDRIETRDQFEDEVYPDWGETHSYSDWGTHPNSWLDRGGREAVASELRLDGADLSLFETDPEAWMEVNAEAEEGDYWWGPYNPLWGALERAWGRMLGESLNSPRRMEAIRRAFVGQSFVRQSVDLKTWRSQRTASELLASRHEEVAS